MAAPQRRTESKHARTGGRPLFHPIVPDFHVRVAERKPRRSDEQQRQRGKLRTREHVVADLGVNFVERQVLLAGFAAGRVAPDYGLDLRMVTFSPVGEVLVRIRDALCKLVSLKDNRLLVTFP